MSFSKSTTPLWHALFYSETNNVDEILKNRRVQSKSQKTNCSYNNTFEYIYSKYLNSLPVSNSIYRKLERGEYIEDEYLRPKTDEYGCEINIDEEDIIDLDNYDDFEERHENYMSDEDLSSSSDEDESDDYWEPV